jgi:hypothetical protein
MASDFGRLTWLQPRHEEEPVSRTGSSVGCSGRGAGPRPRADGQSNADICALAAFRPTVSVVLSAGRSKGFQVSPTTFS